MFLARLALAALAVPAVALAQDDGAPTTIELYAPSGSGDVVAETTVGIPVLLEEFVIPGSAVEPIPVDDPGRADVIIERKNWFKHGDSYRYNLKVTPFIMGEIDLVEYLQREDGSPLADVDPIVIGVDTALDDPERFTLPIDPEIPLPGRVGGYRSLLILFGVLWVLGLFALLFVGRRSKRRADARAAAPPPTLAERLEPLIVRAQAGELGDDERAELERLVIAHWRKVRRLEDVPVADAVAQLRRDDEAGPLMRKIEEWLHRPSTEPMSEAQIAELLEPYRGAAR